MNPRASWTWLLATLMVAAAAPAQDQDDDLGFERPEKLREAPTDGFWPTDLMIERFLDHMVFNELADQYGLDQEQMIRTRELLGERIPAWMQENKAEIKTAINYFIEAQMGFEPPSPEEVQEWAQRVLPVANEFRELVGGMTEDMGTFLDDDQLSKLEAESAAFDAGFNLATGKLKNWAGGGYDPEVDWTPPGVDRRRREREEERKMQAAMNEARESVAGSRPPGEERWAEAAARDSDPGRPVTQDGVDAGPEGARAEPGGPRRPGRAERGGRDAAPAEPADEWATFTEKFIKDYAFNPEQAQKARTYLKAAQRARGMFLKKNDARIAKLTARLDKPADKDDGAAARKEYGEVMADMNKMFDQLKANLDKLPTRAQRKAYDEAHPAKPETPKKKPTDTARAGEKSDGE